MKTLELRIPLPMTVDEHNVAQMWSVNEQSRKETGGGEGVEILKNEPFEGKEFLGGRFNKGQYTYKIYHIETKIPKTLKALLKPIVGKSGFELHEEAWNAYPYCLTVLTNPGYMKDNFKIIIETLHLPGKPDQDNVLNKPKEEYAKIAKHTANVVGDKCTMIKDIDPLHYRSQKANRGPLDPKAWMDTTQPIMTCYKFISVHFKWLGLQTVVESQALEQYKKMLTAFYQQVWCWTDEWHGMTMEDIRRLEHETKEELKKNIKEKEKRGTTDMD